MCLLLNGKVHKLNKVSRNVNSHQRGFRTIIFKIMWPAKWEDKTESLMIATSTALKSYWGSTPSSFVNQ